MVLFVGATVVREGRVEAAATEKATEKENELNARQAFAAARYDEAIELFARLYAETLNPIYLRNIGRCHQKKREADKAIDAFRDYLDKGKSISSAERREILGYIKQMEQLRDEQAKERQAEVTPALKAAPPAATPTAAPPAGAATGPGPGPTTAVTTVNLTPAPNAGGANGGPPTPPPGGPGKDPVLLSSGPGGQPAAGESHPIYTRWWFWTTIGVVVAGGVAAALLIPGGVTKPTCVAPARCL